MVALVSCRDPNATDELNLFVASSLTEVAEDWEARFEMANPETDVVLNFGGSPTLRDQIVAGAPAGVFVAASPEIIGELMEQDLVSAGPVTVAANRLAIAVPVGNPAAIQGLADFDRSELLIGLCDLDVPCGSLAQAALDQQDIVADPDTREPSVRSLLAKVEAGELDAAVVYRSDVTENDAVESVAVGDDPPIVAEYPAVTLHDAGAAADRFLSFLQSAEAQEALVEHGLQAP